MAVLVVAPAVLRTRHNAVFPDGELSYYSVWTYAFFFLTPKPKQALLSVRAEFPEFPK
jgi:hypothetical protein